MAELHAIGLESTHRWRENLRTGEPVCLGRSPRSGLRVPWDKMISREHALLRFDGNHLNVQCLETARNKIYFQNEPHTDFSLEPGEEFRIGRTTFRLIAVEIDDQSHDLLHRETFTAGDLEHVQFGRADHRLEVLASLPGTITSCNDDTDFALRLTRLLLDGVAAADGAAVVKWGSEPGETPEVCRWETRQDLEQGFRPSRRLMLEGINRGEMVYHVWSDADECEQAFTRRGNMDWAFCVPIGGEACQGWCLYLSGQTGIQLETPQQLKGDMRFVQLVAEFVGSIGRVLQLEKQRAGMSRFFSPAVVESFRNEYRDVAFDGNGDANRSSHSSLLAPREGNISVLFCDLRGFSKQAEQSAGDLRKLMERVSDALGVMTRSIMRYEGIVADFFGDAALGFWGWPDEAEDGPLLACRAGLAILEEFHQHVHEPGSPLEGFRVGIGIAHGQAIAGRIGTAEQAKAGVFGPVVNLGSRLEGITKRFRTQILLDETTADFARRQLPKDVGRLRRLARVRPAGMDTDLVVTELLPPAGQLGCQIDDKAVADYESALEAFQDGRWSEALDLLDMLPVQDRVKHFLMVHIAQHGYEAPEGWDGVIRLSSK